MTTFCGLLLVYITHSLAICDSFTAKQMKMSSPQKKALQKPKVCVREIDRSIYLSRERERNRERDIYIYREREREIEKTHHLETSRQVCWS